MKITLESTSGYTHVFEVNGIEMKVTARNVNEAQQKIRMMFQAANSQEIEFDMEGWE